MPKHARVRSISTVQVEVAPRDQSQTNHHNSRAARATNCANHQTLDHPSTRWVSPESPRSNPRVPVLRYKGSSTVLCVLRAARTPAVQHRILGFEQTNLVDHSRDGNSRRAVISDKGFIHVNVNNQQSAHAFNCSSVNRRNESSSAASVS
jgi:hypothetical protein